MPRRKDSVKVRRQPKKQQGDKQVPFAREAVKEFNAW
jgi:hypothetical protein